MSRTIPFEGDDAPKSAPAPLPPRRRSDGERGSEEERWVLGAGRAGPTELGRSGLWELGVPPGWWRATSLDLLTAGAHRISSLWAERDPKGVLLRALWLGEAGTRGILVRTLLDAPPPRVESLLPELSPALYFEREIAEMFGVEFHASPDPRPLLLHYRHALPPMIAAPDRAPPLDERSRFDFAPVEGEGVYEVPVGPVHAGIIEPGHFRFQVVGEEILDLEVRLGYTHKGTERLFEGLDPRRGTQLASSISGDHSVAGAVAYATAVEHALGHPPLERPTEMRRGALLEVERMAHLLGDIAGIVLDVGYAAGAAQANVLRNEAYTVLEELTGSRLGRGAVAVGGLARPLPREGLRPLAARADAVAKATVALLRHLEERPSVMDRVRGTGVVSKEVARALELVGPVARASGLDRDVRRDRPYGAYRGTELRVTHGSTGDVEARLRVKVDEVVEASRLFGTFLRRSGEAPAVPPAEPPRDGPGFGVGLVEAPRGELLFAVSLDLERGKLSRVHVREPSYLNWPAIEYAVHGNILPDFPLCNKSLNLSYSGFDR